MSKPKVTRNYWCSTCHVSHMFERIADVYVSRQEPEGRCAKTFLVPNKETLALAYSVERRENFREYTG